METASRSIDIGQSLRREHNIAIHMVSKDRKFGKTVFKQIQSVCEKFAKAYGLKTEKKRPYSFRIFSKRKDLVFRVHPGGFLSSPPFYFRGCVGVFGSSEARIGCQIITDSKRFDEFSESFITAVLIRWFVQKQST